MTHKQRFEAAMNFLQPDDMVAMMELEFQIFGEYIGEDPVVGYQYAALSPKEKDRAIHRNAELFVETAYRAGHDVIRDVPSYWEVAPGVPALIWLPELDDRLAQLKAIKQAAGDEFFIVSSTGGMVGGIPDGEHIDEFVSRIYNDPDDVHAEAEAALQNMFKVQNMMAEAGVDGVLNCTDISINTGTFLSPAQLDAFFFPYFNRWVESVKQDGLLSILHTDGNVMQVMDRLLVSGVDAIQCIDPLGGMDIVALKKQVTGKLALIGNVDCSILQLGTAAEIDEACRRVIEGCKEGGGFALCACNSIFKGISAENYDVMVKARVKYGSYGQFT